ALEQPVVSAEPVLRQRRGHRFKPVGHFRGCHEEPDHIKLSCIVAPSKTGREVSMKRLLVSLGVVLSFISCSGGAPAEQPKPPAEIPITSKSPEAIEHFKKGRDLSDNIRQAEATAELNQAIKLDPDFALAIAYRGTATQGP